MPYAEDSKSVLALSQYLGYKPKVTSPSITTLSLYHLVPSIGTGINNKPDETYYLRIREGMVVEAQSNSTQFRTTEMVDFADEYNREVTVYQRDSDTGEPSFYLVKKQVQAISSIINEKTLTFGSYEAFRTIELSETNIIQIVDVRDGDGNKYYEVPYLGQEMVFIEEKNTLSNDPELFQFRDTVPYILKTLKTPRRFVIKVNDDNTTTIQFGAGDPTASDEQLIPNLKNVGLGLPNSISRLEESFDPTNFLKTKAYGISPSNTTITVKYYTGGGVASNVESDQLTKITSIEFDNEYSDLNTAQIGTYNSLKNSIAVTNKIPATGGRGPETIEEIRQTYR